MSRYVRMLGLLLPFALAGCTESKTVRAIGAVEGGNGQGAEIMLWYIPQGGDLPHAEEDFLEVLVNGETLVYAEPFSSPSYRLYGQPFELKQFGSFITDPGTFTIELRDADGTTVFETEAFHCGAGEVCRVFAYGEIAAPESLIMVEPVPENVACALRGETAHIRFLNVSGGETTLQAWVGDPWQNPMILSEPLAYGEMWEGELPQDEDLMLAWADGALFPIERTSDAFIVGLARGSVAGSQSCGF